MRQSASLKAAVLAAFAANGVVADSKFSLDTIDDAKRTASTLSFDAMQYYHGNESGETPGILPGPPPSGDYYWWNGAALWSSLIEYWYYTGDSTYNDVTMQGLLFQTGENNNYMPLNYTATMGNDDQAFWALAAMQAAERTFPDPPSDQPQWLQLAENVFQNMIDRWNPSDTCNGGLRWQIPQSNAGYDYVNSISTGCLFALSSRLARYTANETYADWAEKTWTWMENVNFIDNKTHAVYDGANVQNNCTKINKIEFSYVNGIFVLGAAHMYNYTDGDEKWKGRFDKLVDYGLDFFFPEGVAVERPCETVDRCTTDMQMFKGFLHQWYAQAIQLVPSAMEQVLPTLQKSAKAAISQCTGETESRQCGLDWESGEYDGTIGINPELSVLNAVFSSFVSDSKAPVTAKDGGSSKAGGGSKGSGGSDEGSSEDGSGEDGDKGGSGKDGDSRGAATALGISSSVSAFAVISSIVIALW